MDCIAEILHLFESRGSTEYFGEMVSQRDHALQAAFLAESEGASDALVIAALLHDIGHLLEPGEDPAPRGIDGRHEENGCAWLSNHFGQEVTEPVRLHVAAKRYLSTTDPNYFGILSAGSVRSLELQGGLLTPDEVAAFESNPFHSSAVRVRRWDDAAKVPGWNVPGLEQYEAKLRRILQEQSRPGL
jgi:phosphonate degradation associated HDIG domain protein